MRTHLITAYDATQLASESWHFRRGEGSAYIGEGNEIRDAQPPGNMHALRARLLQRIFLPSILVPSRGYVHTQVCRPATHDLGPCQWPSFQVYAAAAFFVSDVSHRVSVPWARPGCEAAGPMALRVSVLRGPVGLGLPWKEGGGQGAKRLCLWGWAGPRGGHPSILVILGLPTTSWKVRNGGRAATRT